MYMPIIFQRENNYPVTSCSAGNIEPSALFLYILEKLVAFFYILEDLVSSFAISICV